MKACVFLPTNFDMISIGSTMEEYLTIYTVNGESFCTQHAQ